MLPESYLIVTPIILGWIEICYDKPLVPLAVSGLWHGSSLLDLAGPCARPLFLVQVQEVDAVGQKQNSTQGCGNTGQVQGGGDLTLTDGDAVPKHSRKSLCAPGGPRSPGQGGKDQAESTVPPQRLIRHGSRRRCVASRVKIVAVSARSPFSSARAQSTQDIGKDLRLSLSG